MTSADRTPQGAPVVPPLFGAIQTMLKRATRRFAGGRGARRLQLIESLPLGGKRQLMLVTCDGRDFLLGAGADSITAITAIAATSPGAPGTPAEPRHAGHLGASTAARSFVQ